MPTIAENHQRIGKGHQAIRDEFHEVGHHTKGNVRPYNKEHVALLSGPVLCGMTASSSMGPAYVGLIPNRIAPLAIIIGALSKPHQGARAEFRHYV